MNIFIAEVFEVNCIYLILLGNVAKIIQDIFYVAF